MCDPILSKVFLYINSGWPNKVDEEIKPYFQRQNKLSIENNAIMWGYRIIIPRKIRQDLLQKIHVSHMGISKTKSLARAYFWWPKLDENIEEMIKTCDVCMSLRPNPPTSKIINWPGTSKPYERVHIDFLGPINTKIYLIITDAYSKWPEVFEMTTMDSSKTLEKLRETFVRFGLPEYLVSDNGAQLTSEEFNNFCKLNQIKHLTSPPYHPATNGAAENAVKSFKSAIYKMMKDKKNVNVLMSTLISRCLLMYRNTPHWTTDETPSKLMFGRELRTRLDFLRRTRKEKQVNNKEGRECVYKVGVTVYTRDYRNSKSPVWVKGVVTEVLGERVYIVKVEPGLEWKRYLDQIISAYAEPEIESSSKQCEISVKNNNNVLNETKHSTPLAIIKPKRFIKPVDKLNL